VGVYGVDEAGARLRAWPACESALLRTSVNEAEIGGTNLA
jgi:hypothetical protein